MSGWHDRVGYLTLFEALTGGAFDRQNWQHSGEFDQIFFQKSNATGFAWGGEGWAVLELTRTQRVMLALNLICGYWSFCFCL